MKKLNILLITAFLLSSSIANAQYNTTTDLFGDFSKDLSVYKGKKFLIDELLKADQSVKNLEIIALSAAQSGELTTLIYKSENEEQEGLLLGFYGNYWNEAGVVHKGYGFKYLDTKNALDFLYSTKTNLENNKKYLKNENNNIYFKFDDITILATGNSIGGFVLRVFWQNFDSEWESGSFNRTLKRFEKRLEKLNK